MARSGFILQFLEEAVNMGYALKIEMVDFADVSLDHVNFVDSIPCTGITLNTDSITVTKCEDTTQLSATLTPQNTTDHVVWTSSNENVATVSSSGLVTVHGIGTATITATCGTQTATATVTQTSIKPSNTYLNEGKALGSQAATGGGYVLGSSTAAGNNSIGQVYDANNVSLHIHNTHVIECIPVPYGASKVKFTTTDGQQHQISYVYRVNPASLIEHDGDYYPEYINNSTFVKSDVGTDVSYGQAVALRPTDEQLPYVGDVYFD